MVTEPRGVGHAPDLAGPPAGELTSPAALKAQAEHAYTESAAYSHSLALLGTPHLSRVQHKGGGHATVLESRSADKDAVPPCPATPLVASFAGKAAGSGARGTDKARSRQYSHAAGHSSPDGSASSGWPGFLPSLRDAPGTPGASMSTAHGGSVEVATAPSPGTAKSDGYAAPPFVHDGSPESDDSVVGGQAARPPPPVAASTAPVASARPLVVKDDGHSQGLVRVSAHAPFLVTAYQDEAAAAAAGSAARVMGPSAHKGSGNEADSEEEDLRSQMGACEGRAADERTFQAHLASASGVRRQLATGFLPRHHASGPAFSGVLKDAAATQAMVPLFPRLGVVTGLAGAFLPGLVGPGLGMRGPSGRRLFVCRFRQRHFSCGRALGGHMKTHRGEDVGNCEGKDADEPDPKSTSDSYYVAGAAHAQPGGSQARDPERPLAQPGTENTDPMSLSPEDSVNEGLEECSEPGDSRAVGVPGYEEEDVAEEAKSRKRERGTGEADVQGRWEDGRVSKEPRSSAPGMSKEGSVEEEGEEGENAANVEEMGEAMGSGKGEGEQASFPEPGVILGRGRRQPRPPGRWAGLEGVGSATDGMPQGRSVAPLPLQCEECLRAFESPRALSQHRRFHRPSLWKGGAKDEADFGGKQRGAQNEGESVEDQKERTPEEEGGPSAGDEVCGEEENNEKFGEQSSEGDRGTGDDSGNESDERDGAGEESAAGSNAIRGWARTRREAADRLPRSRLPLSPPLQPTQQQQQQRQQPKLPGKRGYEGGKKERGFECTECERVFASWKALFGHMRCHPERQWRGIHRPTSSGPTPTSRQGTAHADEDDDEEQQNVEDGGEFRQHGVPRKALDDVEDEDTGIAHTSWGRSPSTPAASRGSPPQGFASRGKRADLSPWDYAGEKGGEKGGGSRLQQRQQGEGVRVVKRPRTLDHSASRKKLEAGAWAGGEEQDEEGAVLASRHKVGGWSVRRLKSPREPSASRGPRHPAGPLSRSGKEEAGLLRAQGSKGLPAASSEEEQQVWDTASCLVFMAASSSSSSAGLDAALSSLRGPKRSISCGANAGLKPHVRAPDGAVEGEEESEEEDKGSQEESEKKEEGDRAQHLDAKDAYDSDDSSYFEEGPRQDSSSPSPDLRVARARSWALEPDEEEEEDPEEDEEEDTELQGAKRGDWRRGAGMVRRKERGPHSGQASIWGAYRSSAEGLQHKTSDAESEHSARSADMDSPGAHNRYAEDDAGEDNEDDEGVSASQGPLAQPIKAPSSWRKGQPAGSGSSQWAPDTSAALSFHPTLSRDANLSMSSHGSSSAVANDGAGMGVKGGGGGGKGKYVCSKCSRSFSSYQALGGHRSSHRRGARGSVSSPSAADDSADPPSAFKSNRTPSSPTPSLQGEGGAPQPLASNPSPGVKGPGTPAPAGQQRQPWLSPPSHSAFFQPQAKPEQPRGGDAAGSPFGWGSGPQSPRGLPPRGQRSPRMGPTSPARPPVLRFNSAGSREGWCGPLGSAGPPSGLPGGRRTRRKWQAGKQQNTHAEGIASNPSAPMGGSASDDKAKSLEHVSGAMAEPSHGGVSKPVQPPQQPQYVLHQHHLQHSQHATLHEDTLAPSILPQPHRPPASDHPGGGSQDQATGLQEPSKGAPLLNLNKTSNGGDWPEGGAGGVSGTPFQVESGHGMVPAINLTCHDTMSPPSTPSESVAAAPSFHAPPCSSGFTPHNPATPGWAAFVPEMHRSSVPWAVPAGPVGSFPAHSSHATGLPTAVADTRTEAEAGQLRAVNSSPVGTSAVAWPMTGEDRALQGGALPQPGPAEGGRNPMSNVGSSGAAPRIAGMEAPAGSSGTAHAGAHTSRAPA